MDVTSLLSVPVWIMEPFTILQKAAEIMEYTELLDAADTCKDANERYAWLASPWRLCWMCCWMCCFDVNICHCIGCRFAWVAAYCVSPFGSAERAWKPFNPILGETFEVDAGNGVRYLAEQVRRQADHSHCRGSQTATVAIGQQVEQLP